MLLTFKYYLYFILVCALTVAIGVFYIAPISTWFVATALLLALLVPTTIPPLPRMAVTLLAGLMMAIMVVAVSFSQSHIPLLAGLLVVSTFACVAFSIYKVSYRYLAAMLFFYVVIASSKGMAHDTPAICYRGGVIFLGSAVATLPQLIFVANFIRNELHDWTINTLIKLGSLSEEIFECFVRSEYADNVYLFERRLHLRKSDFLRSLKMMRQWLHLYEHRNKRQTNIEIIVTAHQRLLRVEFMFDLLMDCAQLRRRVSDHTVFSLCQNELEAVAIELKKIFKHLAYVGTRREREVDILALLSKIKLLEENFQTVVQVAAREPLAFLLFITSLKNLHEEMVLYA